MMEFTYDGVVRHGFGFHNPNHAAALFCAMMPFLWAAWFRWRTWAARAVVAAGTVLLLAGLAATFSRTGLVVFAGEALLFLLLRKGAGWKVLAGLACAAVVVVAVSGVWARFVIDASFLNRFRIWRAGAELFAANPWTGVGLGNSGLLASAFLLPEGITCRTLVNSHLTLLAEFGLPVGFLWLVASIYALWEARRYPAACAALAGLFVSAFMASLFDWHVLFDFKESGGLGRLNFLLSWGVFLFYLGLLLSFVAAGLRRDINAMRGSPCKGARGIVCAVGTAALVVAGPGCLPHGAAPKVKDGFAMGAQSERMTLVLYGHDWPLKTVVPFLPEEGWRVPLRPWEGGAPDIRADAVILFGDCASYASEYPDAKITLVSPPPHFRLPPNVETLWLRAFGDTEALREQAFEQNAGVIVF